MRRCDRFARSQRDKGSLREYPKGLSSAELNPPMTTPLKKDRKFYWD
jgi:hypothetical protein